MGKLSYLGSGDYNIHLLLTSSNLADIYVYDTLKLYCNAKRDSIYEIDNQRSFKNMLELVNMQPNLADRWLFIINYSKVKSLLKNNISFFSSDTSVFLVKADNYSSFKEFKEFKLSVNDLYLESIKRQEVMDLLRDFEISYSLKEYVASSYFKDPDKVFLLSNELRNGAIINSPKDIINLCGESMGSIQRFTMQLLVDEPKSERFLRRSYKKRVLSLSNICDSFGSRKAYNFLRSSVKDILHIKMLYLQGTIYDRISYLPDCFDEKKLSRYSFYLKTIAERVSYNRIICLYNTLNLYGSWNGVQDGILFLYKYYIDLISNSLGDVS